MSTINGLQLPFGLPVPETATAAWGCRLIVGQDGYVDFVPDRQGTAGGDQEFLSLLSQQYSVDRLRKDVKALLESGEMSTRERRDFVLFDSEQLEVHANTNASAGYCYVAAWRKP